MSAESAMSAASAAGRLARAQRTLRRAEAQAGVRQDSWAPREESLPIAAQLQGLGLHLPPGGAIGVGGSTALLLTLLGAAGAGGRWIAVVGMPNLGIRAAADYGVDLSRLVLIPDPGAQAPQVLAAVIDGFDIVVAGEHLRLGAGQRRSLLGRARTQRTLVVAPLWPEVPVQLRAEASTWEGVERGGGYLREQRLRVRRTGRGGAREVQVSLAAPGSAPPGSAPPGSLAGEPAVEPIWELSHAG